MTRKIRKGYWVEIVNQRDPIFMGEANCWEILVDGKILQFHKESAAEHIEASFVLVNVIQWYYGLER